MNYLLNKPTNQENQANKLKEALGAMYVQDKMERGSLSIEEDAHMKKTLELKAYECPKSLIQGKNTFKREILNNFNFIKEVFIF